MSDIRYVTGTSAVDRVTADDQYLAVQGTRDGAIYTADWFRARAFEGRMFVANGGTGTSPISFSTGNIDTTEPDLWVSVPLGTTIIPVEIVIKFETWGTAALLEIMASTGTGGSYSSGGTAVTPKNLRADAIVTSGCTIYSAVDASGVTYMTTNVAEFYRDGLQSALTIATVTSYGQPETYKWNALTSAVQPIVTGAGQLAIFCPSQTGSGFINFTYVEVPSTSII